MQHVQKIIRSLCERAITERETLTALDQIIGDGDFGVNIERGAVAILAALGELEAPEPTDQLLASLGMTLNGAGCGTCGTLISFGMIAGAARCDDAGAFLEAALARIIQAGHARPGDKTMIDALKPAVAVFQSGGNLECAARAAWQGAEATKDMVGAKGRSLYSGSRAKGIPDPGAYLVAALMDEAVRCGGRNS